MRVVAGVVVLWSLAVVGAAPGRPPAPSLKQAALTQIAKAVEADRIDAATAAEGRAAVDRAAALSGRLPAPRRAPLTSGLAQIASLGGKLIEPRAKAVFAELEVNSDYLATRRPPAAKTDVVDGEGVVYRWFSGRGFVFHPLANAVALNAAVRGGDAERTRQLAEALLARAVPQAGGGLAWEYYFDYGSGRAPWTSGMAQAVLAQAFSAAATVGAGDTDELLAAAQAAYRTIPGRLVRQLPSGPWIKLYSFNRLVVLNAQLQAILSLRAYARAAADEQAASLASRLQAAAAAELPEFDTGYWTYYSLPHNPSPLDYQQYVVSLLKLLRSSDERFGEAAKRFAAYETQRPVFRLADGGVGAVRFWLSKPANVELSAVGPARRLWLASGWHSVRWALPRRPGIYPVKLTARDPAGNRTTIEALPIVKVVPTAARPEQSSIVRATGSATKRTARTQATPGFVVGAGVEDPSQATLAKEQKLGAIKLTLAWPLGATVPDATTVQALRRVPQSARLLVELAADPIPADDETRAALAAYAASLVQQVPGLRDLVLGPAPITVTAAAYASTLSAVFDAAKSVRSTVAVAALLDGAAGPKATLAAEAAAFRASGRSAPFFDELVFRPAPTALGSTWTLSEHSRLTSALATSFAGTAQPSAPPVLIDGISVETLIPPVKAGSYIAPPGSGVAESEQAAAYLQALEGAACKANASGVLLERLVDGPGPGEQAGLLYADGTPKASAASVAKAFESAARGTLCRGRAEPSPAPVPTPAPAPAPSAAPAPVPAAGELVFPAALRRSSAPSVRVGCILDCLYLVTLDRADGKPMLARRGALEGGAKTTAVRLPKLPLPAGSYTLSVRILAQSNPGPIELTTSPPLALG